MDSKEAKVFHVTAEGFDESTVHSPTHHVHRHPKDQSTRSHDHPDDEHHFFHQIVLALAGAEEILVTGPAVTKLHFLRYLHQKEAALESRVVGVETSDHPSDRQIVAHVRAYFRPVTDAPPGSQR